MDDEEALTRALYLALIAPTEDQCERASELAGRIATRLTWGQVERAKVQASARAEMKNRS